MNAKKYQNELASTLDELHTNEDVDFFGSAASTEKNAFENDLENAQAKNPWLDGDDSYEGQLSVDVYQTDEEIVVQSTIAGVKPEDLDISIHNNMITIRGRRSRRNTVEENSYLYQECYWGGFSRSIILPVDVVSDHAQAEMEDGVLTITLPKANKAKVTTLTVQEKKS